MPAPMLRDARLAIALAVALVFVLSAPSHATDHASEEGKPAEAAAPAGDAGADTDAAAATDPDTGTEMEPGDPAVTAKPWDQAEVTRLARQLAGEVGEIREATKQLPQAEMSIRRARHEWEETVRLLRDQTRRLASRLEGGAGLEETRPIARNIAQLRNRAAVAGRRANLPTQVTEPIVRAQKTVAALRPYYAAQ